MIRALCGLLLVLGLALTLSGVVTTLATPEEARPGATTSLSTETPPETPEATGVSGTEQSLAGAWLLALGCFGWIRTAARPDTDPEAQNP